jgi:hypothetical protein
LTDMENN